MTQIAPKAPADHHVIDAKPARKRSQIGPYSREGALAVLDKRSGDALFLKRKRAELTKHVGGSPSATQTILINQASMLMLRLAKMDERMLLGTDTADRTGRQYLAWSNALSRTMKALGLKAAPAPVETPQQHLARRATEKAAEAARLGKVASE